uniref:hypothetical protein n=1 Tax=Altererythrobacter segetis TaxID=1104773 RepID=UPI00140AEBEF|nr:hypothetical protein [Altererythrobacter segetis]
MVAIIAATALGWAAGALSDQLALVVALLTAAVVLYADPQWTWTLPEHLDCY